METFAYLGFVFGIFGVTAFGLAIAATAQLKELRRELAALRDQVVSGKPPAS